MSIKWISQNGVPHLKYQMLIPKHLHLKIEQYHSQSKNNSFSKTINEILNEFFILIELKQELSKSKGDK